MFNLQSTATEANLTTTVAFTIPVNDTPAKLALFHKAERREAAGGRRACHSAKQLLSAALGKLTGAAGWSNVATDNLWQEHLATELPPIPEETEDWEDQVRDSQRIARIFLRLGVEGQDLLRLAAMEALARAKEG